MWRYNVAGRCRSCDKKLSSYELVRKLRSPITNKISYLELCSACIKAGDYDDFQLIDGKVTALLDLEDE